jgi:hypothetical protein
MFSFGQSVVTSALWIAMTIRSRRGRGESIVLDMFQLHANLGRPTWLGSELHQPKSPKTKSLISLK